MEERKFSEQELVRREKLQELVDKGIDPFGQRFDVTAYSKASQRESVLHAYSRSRWSNPVICT